MEEKPKFDQTDYLKYYWCLERLDEEQKQKYEEFKGRVTHPEFKDTENTLIKFLAARKWNIDDAEKMLNERIEFFEEHNLNRSIPESEFEPVAEDAPNVIFKHD